MSSWTFFRLAGGEVIRSQHHQPSGSNCSGIYVLWVDKVNFIHLMGVSVKQLKGIVLCIPQGREAPAPRLHYCFWNVPCLCILSLPYFSSVQSLSHVRLCNPMNHSTPGFPVHHQLPEPTQTHVHRVGDAIQPSHPLFSPSPPAFNLSQHQGLFQ